jgi:hypothetical protein
MQLLYQSHLRDVRAQKFSRDMQTLRWAQVGALSRRKNRNVERCDCGPSRLANDSGMFFAIYNEDGRQRL